jgi:hypothetical protein
LPDKESKIIPKVIAGFTQILEKDEDWKEFKQAKLSQKEAAEAAKQAKLGGNKGLQGPGMNAPPTGLNASKMRRGTVKGGGPGGQAAQAGPNNSGKSGKSNKSTV